MKFYTGIGSRTTPDQFLRQMLNIASVLARAGYCLRSGGADGADTSFASGAFKAQGEYEIYVPWNGFGGYRYGMANVHVGVSPAALAMAAEFHPAWDRCGNGARKLHARNCYQVLGANLDTPSEFVICWTFNGERGGGTGQALRIAEARGITIYDLAIPSAHMLLTERLESITAEEARQCLPASMA